MIPEKGLDISGYFSAITNSITILWHDLVLFSSILFFIGINILLNRLRNKRTP